MLVWKEKVKFEDWKVAMNYFEKDSYLFKFDLTSGYFHIDLNKKFQTYVGFKVDKIFYCFTVLPFGLSSAPYIFTKCLKPMVKYWRKNCIKIVMFLDDGLDIRRGLEQAYREANFVKNSLTQAGFIINNDKSVWDPQLALEWTGIWWDGGTCSISIPDRRIDDLKNEISQVSNMFPKTTARSIAKIVGKIISMMPVIGNVARLKTRYMYSMINNRLSWDNIFSISQFDSALDEMFFWKYTVDSLNTRSLSDYNLPEIICFSDASSVAAGAYSVNFKDHICHAFWSNEDAQKSSTFREIKAVSIALDSFGGKLSNKAVKWFTDSQNCMRILQSGSCKEELHDLACKIYSFCASKGISLDVQWIPRSQNVQADFISKAIDYDDWGVSDEFFTFINSIYRPHSVDGFANHENRKMKRFNSVVWNPECEQVDAFSVSWAGENNWLVPPIYLIPKVLRHIVLCKASGTLVVPHWISAPFWPLLFDKDSFCANFVADILDFSADQNIYVQGRNKNALFGSERFKSNVLVIRLEPMGHLL